MGKRVKKKNIVQSSSWAKAKSPSGARAGCADIRSDTRTVQAMQAAVKRKGSTDKKAKKAKTDKTTCDLCPSFGACGGCSLLNVLYDEQLAYKQKRIEELFSELASQDTIRQILGMANPFYYRDKVSSPVVLGKRRAHGKQQILTGMYERGTHRLVSADHCLLENQVGNQVVRAVRSIMNRHDMQPYDEDTGCGFMRHVVARVGHTSGEVLVTLVTNSDEFPSSKSFCRELVKQVPEITTVVQNINTSRTNVILGQNSRTLYGPGFILDELCGLSFRISSRSFYQVNATQTEVLYEAALDLAKVEQASLVIDAYCGTGTIGLVAAKRGAAHVVGFDSVAPAIRDARQNAQHNGIDQAEFIVGDAADVLGGFTDALCCGQRMVSPNQVPNQVDAHVCRVADCLGSTSGTEAKKGNAIDSGSCHESSSHDSTSDNDSSHCLSSDFSDAVLVMDPPRAGATPDFLRAAASMHPGRIVYISCNPVTQARDVRLLCDYGYTVKAVQPVDMFPHTDHIESIVVMS